MKAIRALAFVSTLEATCGCASLLGIDEAVCDPSFDRNCEENAGPDFDSGTSDSSPTDPTGAPDANTDANTDASTDASAPTAHNLACNEYCSVVQQACVDSNLQYAGEDSCLEICNQLMQTESEQPDPQSTDTIECRTEAARSVIEVGSEVDNLCQSAGMWGNDECGAPCEVYCSMLAKGCQQQFAAFDDCRESCAEVPSPALPFGTEVPAGDTLQCRINHIRLATTDRNPGTHCPHAAGAGPCSGQ